MLVSGGTGTDNLILNGTNDALNVTFDRPMVATSVTPGQVLSIMGPVGPITGPQNYPSDSTLQVIPSASSTGDGVLSSTATVPSFDGTFKITHVSVQMNIAFSDDSDLSAVLIAPDGTRFPCSRAWEALAETSSIRRSTIRPKRQSPTREPLPRSLALIEPTRAALDSRWQDRRHHEQRPQWVPGSGHSRLPTPPTERTLGTGHSTSRP